MPATDELSGCSLVHGNWKVEGRGSILLFYVALVMAFFYLSLSFALHAFFSYSLCKVFCGHLKNLISSELPQAGIILFIYLFIIYLFISSLTK